MNMQAVQAQMESSWVGPFNLVQWALVLLFLTGLWMFFGKDITARVQAWLANLKGWLVPESRWKDEDVRTVLVDPRQAPPGWRSSVGPESLYETLIASGIEVSAATEFVKTNWEKIMAAKQKREAV